MTMTNDAINYHEFSDFVTKMNNSYECQDDDLDAIKTLLDSYSTFMVTKKHSNEYIKDMRMESIINNYEFYKNAKYNITKDTRYKVTNFLEKIQANPTEPLLSEINKFLNMKEKEFKNLSYCSYEYNLNLLKYCKIIQMKII